MRALCGLQGGSAYRSGGADVLQVIASFAMSSMMVIVFPCIHWIPNEWGLPFPQVLTV